MGKITVELLRKRSEHNEGEILSLEELALHQEKLERIELLDKVCRDLKILLLQNNAISKIENVSRLKNLEYLNLALNLVEKIENLEGCESLKKLDLTLNFVADLISVKNLSGLPKFEQLYMTGNPCQDYEGYRQYVIGVLPNLKSLDGHDVTHAERIEASQELKYLEISILRQQREYFEKNKKPEISVEEEKVLHEERKTDEKPSTNDSDDDSAFWQQKSKDTPEIRREMMRRIEINEEKKKPTEKKKVKRKRNLTTSDGKPLNINEAKLDFFLDDQWERNQFVLDVSLPKHMCTTLITADVHPLHVTVTAKGKVFQLVLQEEVKPDSCTIQRSQTTGHLMVTMPKLHEITISNSSKEKPINLQKKPERVMGKETDRSNVSQELSTSNGKCVVDAEVPPLI